MKYDIETTHTMFNWRIENFDYVEKAGTSSDIDEHLTIQGQWLNAPESPLCCRKRYMLLHGRQG